MTGSRWIIPALNRPRLTITLLVLFALGLATMLPRITVDTNPENMLAADEPVRLFHNQVKEEFTLHDMVVLGIVNEDHPDGVFTPEILSRVLELSRFAQDLRDPDHPEHRVVTRYVLAPDVVDSIRQDGPGQIRFEWLMPSAPGTREEALAIRDRALDNPMLRGTLVSEDGQALAIFLPLSTKDYAFEVRRALLDKIDQFGAVPESYHITGLPVAEETFGVEMFMQMAISAPLAMLAIFLLMLFFFRKFSMVIAPMIVALLAVISTMGLLIGTGHTVHIMSSMIPIFLMPIAVVNSIHILSVFFDKYPQIRDREQTLKEVMDELFVPMIFTSLTSAVGFASLALTPIPPVQVFGLFVAIGILIAWLTTILLVPAYIMLLKPARLADLAAPPAQGGEAEPAGKSLLDRHLGWMGNFTYRRARLIIGLSFLALGLAAWGISLIQVNDNPVKWFTEKHSIREADRVLNHHFAGTYEAYLVLEATEQAVPEPATLATELWEAMWEDYAHPSRVPCDTVLDPPEWWTLQARYEAENLAKVVSDVDEFFRRLEDKWEDRLFAAEDDENYDFWLDALDRLGEMQGRGEIFKQPEVLAWLVELEEHLSAAGTVGKSNSLTSLVRKIYQELLGGEPEDYRLPESAAGVAQTLMAFQNSHRPDDLWHLVTPDFRRANVWLQLRDGDNKVMEQTLADLEEFLAANPPPVELHHAWAGNTYINVIWQDKMVYGMLWAFLGSFVVIFLMMTLLFRSPLWGMLAMVPITVTVAFIYGLIGFIGKDYDMPVAVLSSLTLGLAVDFAIHFLQRSRQAYRRRQQEAAALAEATPVSATPAAKTAPAATPETLWEKARRDVFAEPARAISRNAIVVSVGFMPLLAAPLVPYKTVGFFLAAIMAVSGLATMYMLPAAVKLLTKQLFKR
ncbi:efflux RND transporter permease subunit [Desulfurivibrio alkaliphilus]|uniref:RND superfamily exporter n=1 Tax=Desulfurivibrio alkaliphilus (strain DSM 19089 / UNIQEM U267 / AHT2) TaxID=589865 RepID=D6Z6D5_DESAT|nr:MMPL family transporter [Desulfurivibrio alkaliphilus]ADH86900.1 RND superfamily exporter [Desulfurivibrio alkaliphilus AHT 2]